MAREYGYKVWRQFQGRVKLENPVHEDIAKLQAAERPFAEIAKFVNTTQEEYDKLQNDPMFMARVHHLVIVRKGVQEVPTTSEELRKFAIKALIKLTKAGEKDQTVRVSAAKALFECAGEMKDSKPATKIDPKVAKEFE